MPVCADSAVHARTDSQNTEGGAVWAEHLRWAALESGSFFSGPSRASTDLARRARVPAGSSTPLPFDAGQDFSPSGNGTVDAPPYSPLTSPSEDERQDAALERRV